MAFKKCATCGKDFSGVCFSKGHQIEKNPFNFLGSVKRNLPEEEWSYKLGMFVKKK